MKHYTNGYVGNRVLKFNVGFLLASGPGHSHEMVFDVPAVRVAEDVDLAYVRGPVRLSRTAEGVLVQGDLEVGIETECYRCLDPAFDHIDIDVEELFAYPHPIDSEFVVGEDANIDLSPLLRDEVLIAEGHGVLCKPDCKGLCATCGANLNRETCQCEDEIDPRFAKLRELLNH